jgi:pilus assembly protein CpaF
VFGKRLIPGSEAAAAVVERPPSAPRPAASLPASQPPASPQGGRTPFPSAGLGAPILSAPTSKAGAAGSSNPPPTVPTAVDTRRSDSYYETKGTVFGALIEAIDLGQLAKLDADSAREEIRDIGNEIIAIKNIVMSIAEQEDLLDDICNDVLGYGPLEPLLARDEIADIMVNGSGTVYIEVGGKIQKTGIRFRDNQQLLNICQRIVSQVGRRVDEASPICDARPAGRLPCQRHRAAAGDRRAGAHHPQIQKRQTDARAVGEIWIDLAGRR